MNESRINHSMYTNTSSDYDGIICRMTQRLKWVRGYVKDGKYKRKLEQIKLIKEGYNDY